MQTPPTVLLLGGPNGAGKSTLAARLVPELLGPAEFVNADVIAAELSPHDVDSAAITAGRMMIQRLHALADRRANFAFESTLASRTFAPFLVRLKEAG